MVTIDSDKTESVETTGDVSEQGEIINALQDREANLEEDNEEENDSADSEH